MGLFRKLFRKRPEAADFSAASSDDSGVCGRAESITHIVSAGLAQSDYAGIYRHLSALSDDVEAPKAYVFPRSGNMLPRIGIFFCTILSCAFLCVILLSIRALQSAADPKQISLAVTILILSACILLANAVMIVRAGLNLRFNKRFDRVCRLLDLKELEYITCLATLSDLSAKAAVKTLRRAAILKLIPEGHFSREQTVFFVSDHLYAAYMQNADRCDRYFREQLKKIENAPSASEADSLALTRQMSDQYLQTIYADAASGNRAFLSELERLRQNTSAVLHGIHADPDCLHTLDPVLRNYLSAQARLTAEYRQSQNGSSRKEIGTIVRKVNEEYECLLRRFYEEQASKRLTAVHAEA